MMWQVKKNGMAWVQLQSVDGFWERFKGWMLQSEEELSCEGLWFFDCKAIHTFFMKFSLDIYFLDADHKILKSYFSVAPNKLVWNVDAVSAFEVPSNKISVAEEGDVLEFSKCH